MNSWYAKLLASIAYALLTYFVVSFIVLLGIVALYFLALALMRAIVESAAGPTTS